MRPNEIETWVLSIIERAQSGQPIEDFRVEMKEEWIDPVRAARRIAAHANAARGIPVLWLIGVGERGEVKGAAYSELSRWHSEMESKFDDLAPKLLTDLNIAVQGKTVVALLFETERAPYVVKNPDGGTVTLEVPWREATGVRSAKRVDLLRILSRHQLEPVTEVVNCRFEIPKHSVKKSLLTLRTGLTLDIYLIPRGDEPLVIPFHRCRGYLRDVSSSRDYGFTTLFFTRSFYNVCAGMEESTEFPNVAISRHDIVFRGPGMARVQAFTEESVDEAEEAATLYLSLRLGTADPDVAIELEQALHQIHDPQSQCASWNS